MTTRPSVTTKQINKNVIKTIKNNKQSFGLGRGWDLGFPTIDFVSGDKYNLYLGNGNVYSLTTSMRDGNTRTLDWENRIRYQKIDGKMQFADGSEVSYSNIISYKDGRKDYLSAYNMIGTEDRFGNKIKYTINGSSVKIVDTMNRTIELKKESTSKAGNYTLTWTGLPNNKSVIYTVENNMLTKVIDQENAATSDEYNRNFSVKAKLNTVDEATTTYILMKKITHPTGLVTNYAYRNKRLADYSGSNSNMEYMEIPIFDARYETINDEVHTKTTYSYTHKKWDISKAYVYDLNIDANAIKKKTSYTFDLEGRETEVRVFIGSGDETRDIAKVAYHYPENSTRKLVSKEEHTIPMKKTIEYEYAGSNMTSMTDAQGNKTIFEYHGTYNYLTKKEYQQDENTAIVEKFLPRKDGKAVEWHEVYVNNVLKSLTQYVYDGNRVRQERRYFGNLSEKKQYVYTQYTYGSEFSPEPTVVVSGKVYDSLGTSPYTPATAEEKFSYDWYGRIISKTDPSGNETEYHYDGAGRIKETIDPKGNRFTKEYIVNTTDNYVVEKEIYIRENSTLGRTIRREYSPFGQPVKTFEVLDGLSKKEMLLESYQYDALNRVEKRNAYYADGSVKWITSYEYDILDRPTEICI